MNEDVIAWLEQHDLPFATAKELADAMDIQPSGMNKRLDEIVAETRVEEKTVGARAKVYYLPERAERVNARSKTDDRRR